MRKYRWPMFGAVLTIAFLGASIGSAQAGNWAPAGAQVVIDSTNFSFELEGAGEPFTCEAAVGTGKIKTASTTWTFTPEFSECPSPVKVKGAWTATDVNSEEATLEIPKQKGGSLIFEVSPTCNVLTEGGVTLGSGKDYKNGKNGLTIPSRMSLKQKISIIDSPKECFNKNTSALVSANLSLFNFTNELEAIKVS
jgi:hypothetical protein